MGRQRVTAVSEFANQHGSKGSVIGYQLLGGVNALHSNLHRNDPPGQTPLLPRLEPDPPTPPPGGNLASCYNPWAKPGGEVVCVSARNAIQSLFKAGYRSF